MKLREIAGLLNAKVIVGSERDLDELVSTVASSDLMSDILARVDIPELLLTGLATHQVVRTSSVSGIKAVVLARGKAVTEKMIQIAEEEEVTLMTSPLTLFEASGRLYQEGLRGVAKQTTEG